ncbi:MAG: hypothetical protein QG564_227 [Campylobacterota bacterium]|nr:hypothetical protein [Campylobacterota bacterium]
MAGETKIIYNTITKKEIHRNIPIDKGVPYEGGAMITETDPAGILTYVSRDFVKMAGYSKEELIGSPHSIVRHPDMPKGLFRGLWKTIQERRVWRGYIKNLRKDGKYFWSLMYIQPRFDSNDEIVGYIASRREAYPQSLIEIGIKYKELIDDRFIDDPYFLKWELYLGEGVAKRR